MGHEKLGLPEFYSSDYWKGTLLVNAEKQIFERLGTKQGSLFGLFSSETMEAGKAATERGTEGNFEGDGFQLGGVWIFAADGTCAYEYISSSFGDHPSPTEVLEAAKKVAP